MVGFRIPPTVLHQAVFQQAVLFSFAHFLLFFLLLIPLNPNRIKYETPKAATSCTSQRTMMTCHLRKRRKWTRKSARELCGRWGLRWRPVVSTRPCSLQRRRVPNVTGTPGLTTHAKRKTKKRIKPFSRRVTLTTTWNKNTLSRCSPRGRYMSHKAHNQHGFPVTQETQRLLGDREPTRGPNSLQHRAKESPHWKSLSALPTCYESVSLIIT